MKITRIYLKNLNSLRGPFTINLNEEPFASTGIFAIVGPTGAGKSTILDAITLALYGRAARYDSKPNPENMMSRRTGECQAEVEFEVPKGTYRASWQMKRARGKSDGKMQPAQRFVYDSKGTPIAQKVSEVDALIEELTGLDVDRFFRSVLLAQGDFVKFLKATPDERATLLESLTGTSIYSEISKKAYEEMARRENALKLKEKDLQGIRLLTESERTAHEKQIAKTQEEIEIHTLTLTKWSELISFGKTLEKYLKDRIDLKQQQEVLRQEFKNNEPDFNRLNVFRKGEPYIPELRNLDHFHKNRTDKKNEVEQAKSAVATTKSDVRAGFDATSEMIDRQITDIKKALIDCSITKSTTSKKHDDLKQWLESHLQDETLEENFSHIVEHIISLKHHRDTGQKVDGELRALSKELLLSQQKVKDSHLTEEHASLKHNESTRAFEASTTAYDTILQGKTEKQLQKEIAAHEGHLHYLQKKYAYVMDLEEKNKEIKELTLQRENALKYVEEKDTFLRIEQERIRVLNEKRDELRLIASLEEHRKKLVHGKACPLCGSLDHPFVETSESPHVQDFDVKVSEGRRRLNTYITASATWKETLKNTTENLEKVCAKAKEIKNSLHSLLQDHGQPEERAFECALCYPKNDGSVNIENICEVSQCTCMTEYSIDISALINRSKEKLSNTRSLLERAQDRARERDEAQKIFHETKHTLELIQKDISEHDRSIDSFKEAIEASTTTLSITRAETSSIEISLLHYLEPYAVSIPLYGKEKELKETLEERKKRYQDNCKRSIALENELRNLNISDQAWEQLEKKLELEKEKLNQDYSIAHALYLMDKNVQKKAEFTDRWRSIEEAHSELKRLHESLIQAQSRLEEQGKEFSKAQAVYSEHERNLALELQKTPFETIEGLNTALLTFDDVHRIHAKEEDIKSRSSKLDGQLSQVENEIAILEKTKAHQGELLRELQIKQSEMNTL